MRVLLYGGTFDPPHVGHLNNLRASIAAVRPDRVIVMPAGTPPHKAASSTPAELRYAMCDCFRALGKEIEISRWEIDQGGRSYTILTLEMLHRRWPDAELFLCVGSDMLTSFTGWRRWQDILALATLVVQSRAPGEGEELHRAADALRARGGRILFADARPVPCASRDIRAGRYTGEELEALLPPPVGQIIRENRLYQPSAGDGETERKKTP